MVFLLANSRVLQPRLVPDVPGSMLGFTKVPLLKAWRERGNKRWRFFCFFSHRHLRRSAVSFCYYFNAIIIITIMIVLVISCFFYYYPQRNIMAMIYYTILYMFFVCSSSFKGFYVDDLFFRSAFALNVRGSRKLPHPILNVKHMTYSKVGDSHIVFVGGDG